MSRDHDDGGRSQSMALRIKLLEDKLAAGTASLLFPPHLGWNLQSLLEPL